MLIFKNFNMYLLIFAYITSLIKDGYHQKLRIPFVYYFSVFNIFKSSKLKQLLYAMNLEINNRIFTIRRPWTLRVNLIRIIFAARNCKRTRSYRRNYPGVFLKVQPR